MASRRMFPARRPRNYRWWTETLGFADFDSSTITFGTLIGGNSAVGGSSSGHILLKRIIFDMNLGVDSSTLNQVAISNWGFASWMMIIADEDDDSVYNPDAASDLQEEKVLQHGITERFGWGTVQEPIGDVTKSQSAAFMSTARVHFDKKLNRRLRSDEVVNIYATINDFANLLFEESEEWATGYAQIRCLYEIP